MYTRRAGDMLGTLSNSPSPHWLGFFPPVMCAIVIDTDFKLTVKKIIKIKLSVRKDSSARSIYGDI